MALEAGCRKPAAPVAAQRAKWPAIASLVPSATDLIVGMGAEDHLVAVSSYDRQPQTARLPRVGDYTTIDWETLSQLRPQVLITDYAPSRTPAGLSERMAQLGIGGLNVKFDRLSDVFAAIDTLGQACAEPAKASAEARNIRRALDAVQRRAAGLPRVRALIATEASGLDFAGRGNYLDDLLTAAGGENSIASAGYVTLDREAIVALKPQVVLQLLPDADAGTRARNKAVWDGFPELPAVKDHRVWQYTQTYMMTPGAHVAQVAERFAAALHPQQDLTSQPSNPQSP